MTDVMDLIHLARVKTLSFENIAMYFVSPIVLSRSRNPFKRWRFPQQTQRPDSHKHNVTTSHTNAINELQKVKRNYFLERGPFF